MQTVSRNATAVLLGFLGLASLATVSSLSLTANNLAGLRGVTIRPYGDFSIDPGERLLLTAEGDYATYTVPLRAAWEILEGEDLGYFYDVCDSAKSCEFVAGDDGGDVRIRAEASGHVSEATIRIRRPTPPKPVENPFTDAIPDWAGEPIVKLRERNIVSGYDDGRYGAGDLLTRGQLITIFHRSLKTLKLVPARSDCRQVYNDIAPGHYAFEAACVFRGENWTDSLSTLNPNDPVSRGETALLLNRVVGPALLSASNLNLGRILDDGPYFRDVPRSHSYFADTAVAKTIGLMNGNPDGSFGPSETLNRAEAATIFWRMMQEVEENGMRSI